jgi:hypothetical protein
LPRGAQGTARVALLVAVLPQARAMTLLAENPGWWAHFGALAAKLRSATAVLWAIR